MSNINSLNPAISITAGDFNGNFLRWYSFDTSGNIGKELDIITSTMGDTQIIDKPAHFTNHSSACIDFISTSNPNIIINSSIEKGHCCGFHHDIIYGKVKEYFRTIREYKNVDIGSI